VDNNWDLEIKPKRHIFDINFKEIWDYRDLLMMFVKRDIVTVYKQTVLGPVWFFVQPIMTMFVYIFVFGNIAGLSTDGVPKALFYLSGIVLWNYFSESFTQTSDTFAQNANIFRKVYFPRLIMPMSKVVSGLIKFAIQSALFLSLYTYYLFTTDALHPNITILITPILVLLMAGMGFGFGIIFSSLTTKYRDLKFLIQFGIQLLMYATPIIYPMSTIPEKLRFYLEFNPIAHIIEAFKYAFLGAGEFSIGGIIYASIFTLVTLILGVLIFNKTEQSFMDTV
jgi:lipopolysaccharide transport system permease protein